MYPHDLNPSPLLHILCWSKYQMYDSNQHFPQLVEEPRSQRPKTKKLVELMNSSIVI